MGGIFAFLVCAAAEYALFSWFLVPGLARPEPAEKRRTVIRWFSFNAGIWVLVVIGCIVYIAALRHNSTGYAWIVPPVAALLGTGLPMQFSVMRIARTALS
ncbi:MAG: hypothetical protein J2P43_12025 [Candidatus Dormibacteraeota bacterium]|nr:hypothetical protein [Candidatus Dormibacteraeota bacterium]MBO0745741.1 hypothetical protein [Candidatus Dormibacteraeota bacterium]